MGPAILACFGVITQVWWRFDWFNSINKLLVSGVSVWNYSPLVTWYWQFLKPGLSFKPATGNLYLHFPITGWQPALCGYCQHWALFIETLEYIDLVLNVKIIDENCRTQTPLKFAELALEKLVIASWDWQKFLWVWQSKREHDSSILLSWTLWIVPMHSSILINS